MLSNSALSHIQSGDLDMAERELQEAAGAGGDYPRISSNLALVRSLRSSRAAAPAPLRETVQASPPVAPAAEPELEPRVPVIQTPLPQPAPAGTIAQSPADVPSAQAQPRAADAAPRTLMQKVPVDPLAGPVAPKRTAAVKKRVPVKTQQAEAAPLRRAVDDRQASVEP